MKQLLWIAIVLFGVSWGSSALAITYHGNGSETAPGNTGSITATLPAAPAPGDFLLAHVTYRGPAANVQTPAGWTEVNRSVALSGGSDPLVQAVFWRVAGTGEPLDHTVSFSPTVFRVVLAISHYSGVDTGAPIAAQGVNVNAASATITAPSIDIPADADNAMLVGFFGTVNAAVVTPQTPLVPQYDLNARAGPNGSAAAMGLQALQPLGPTGIRTAIADTTGVNIGLNVALRPATLNNFLVERVGGGLIQTQTAGTAFDIRITARDSGNYPFTGYTGTVDITSTGILGDGEGTTAAFVDGVLTAHSVTILNAGTFTITATGGGASGVSNAFLVNPGDPVALQILVPGESAAPGTPSGKTGTPSDQFQGDPFTARVNAVDAYWNVVSSVTDVVRLTSSDGAATLPADTALASGTQTFSVTLNTVGMQTLSAQNITTPAMSADTSPPIAVLVPGRDFDATDVGTPGIIKTKVAGQGFSLEIIRINPPGEQTVRVELLDASDTAVSLDDKGCPTDPAAWPIIQTLSPDLVFNDENSLTINFTELDAWGNVRVRITSTTHPRSGCSSDNFAIRPYAFSVAASDDDWESVGTARTLHNANASGGNIHKAGMPFTISVTALNFLGDPTSNYSADNFNNGLELVLGDVVQPSACASCALGLLAPGVWTAGGGTATATATYSDAGSFSLTARDTAFADVDAGDSSDAERHILSEDTDIGRFVPHHYTVVVADAGALGAACDAGDFTYLGQSFGYMAGSEPRLAITARNANGDITGNYTDGVVTLQASSVTLDHPTQDSTQLGTDGNPLALVSAPGSATLIDEGGGNFTLTLGADTFYYEREQGVVAPFTSDVRPMVTGLIDDEGVETAAATLPVNIAPTGTPQRYGRLRLENAHGSELLPLGAPVRLEYYAGDNIGFLLNTADSCTSGAAGDFALVKSPTSIPDPSFDDFASGASELHFNCSPCARGHADVTSELNITWLLFDWSGNGTDEEPRSRVSFGVYGGSPRMIFRREAY